MKRAMAHALRISQAAKGHTSPNPPVGAVILDTAGRLAGTGTTQLAGGNHAEIEALREAGSRARGGTAVVTLEPCARQGRTRACAEALINAGIRSAVYGTRDPHPAGAGGADALRAAGIAVRCESLDGAVQRGPLRAWLHHAQVGRPHVTWKYAATLDGRTAAGDGTSQWISGAAARREVHEMRSQADAVVVGTGTVLTDNPALTARSPSGEPAARQPLRVVLGTRRIPASARVRDNVAPTLLLNNHDPHSALCLLSEHGVIDVLLEGGSLLAGVFLECKLIDLIVGYIAPTLLGDGATALARPSVLSISDAVPLELESCQKLGDDIRIVGTPPAR